ncbi:unnamed protein product [Vitrella brassicaformis CCMP3155]|uniref:Uncharacterized protein n=1 Tax=Vitrella brassicaformis (strain CCMP3155) TaxID=1169540 RepID=A0A0G4GHS0_VITBC|nr:unnamed protein product [Vitrella brassicaformis CCMP3155]|eukprot:CEM29280.1 unnamed protein product [Vitrella brassicaformis CCMP3155]
MAAECASPLTPHIPTYSRLNPSLHRTDITLGPIAGSTIMKRRNALLVKVTATNGAEKDGCACNGEDGKKVKEIKDIDTDISQVGAKAVVQYSKASCVSGSSTAATTPRDCKNGVTLMA